MRGEGTTNERPLEDWERAEVLAALAPLATREREETLRGLLRYTGTDPKAWAIAADASLRLGVQRWQEAFSLAPETWLRSSDAPTLGRWLRSYRRLSPQARELLHLVALSPSGFHTATLLSVSGQFQSWTLVQELRAAHWLSEWVAGRIEVPAMRRALVTKWDKTGADSDALVRYAETRLELRERGWNRADNDCLVLCLQDANALAAFDSSTLIQAASQVRHTQAAPVGAAALRKRLTTANSGAERRRMRQALAGTLIDMGVYGESLELLRDSTGPAKVMTAHALIRSGQAGRARALLQGMVCEDRGNWALQWALCAIYLGRASDYALAEESLLRELRRASDSRHRGLFATIMAELDDARQVDSTRWYLRALADFATAGDELCATYCQAKLASAHARLGKMDEARDSAMRSWRRAQSLPGAVLRGSAALACHDSGVAKTEPLTTALRMGALSDDVRLAALAEGALRPSSPASSLSVGPTGVWLDDARIEIAENGPPWRILHYLAELPNGSVLSIDELFQAGWPEQKAQPDSRRRRVQTAIWTLRKAGLRTVITTVKGNRYRLDAGTNCVQDASAIEGVLDTKE